jgi:hypothetical protein
VKVPARMLFVDIQPKNQTTGNGYMTCQKMVRDLQSYCSYVLIIGLGRWIHKRILRHIVH